MEPKQSRKKPNIISSSSECENQRPVKKKKLFLKGPSRIPTVQHDDESKSEDSDHHHRRKEGPVLRQRERVINTEESDSDILDVLSDTTEEAEAEEGFNDHKCYKCSLSRPKKDLVSCGMCSSSYHKNCYPYGLCRYCNVSKEWLCTHCKMERRGACLFRCQKCLDLYHWDCLEKRVLIEPAKKRALVVGSGFYRKDWNCPKCLRWGAVDCIYRVRSVPGEIGGGYVSDDACPGNCFVMVEEAQPLLREFYVHFREMSHRENAWVPESWLKKVSSQKLKNFLLKNEEHQKEEEWRVRRRLKIDDWSKTDMNGNASLNANINPDLNVDIHPSFNDNQSSPIPEEWKTIDRILYEADAPMDNYNDYIISDHSVAFFNSSLKSNRKYYIKWKELTYEHCTWEYAPCSDDAPMYKEGFATAYSRFKARTKVVMANAKFARRDFNPTEHVQRFQPLCETPAHLKNGQLMKHQLDGLNWLLFKYLKQESCILADDMGLGKTIQAIALISHIVYEFGLFPFLVVVPNSTLGNWVNEFEKWAPDLHIVSYCGTSQSRMICKQYEFSPPHFHVCITTFEVLLIDFCVFSSLTWEMCIVDEGHRLKNDSGKLFNKIITLTTHHRILLTGTPLQNSVRELLNLLYFLDPKTHHPEEKYESMTKTKVNELHDLIRPVILRRTKREALSLPPKIELVVPVSMTAVQKTFYKAILSNNYKSLRGKQKKTLFGILMQLRKCVDHPYLFPDNEPELSSQSESHMALISASGKMILLDKILTKLKQQGHRVLIFSQFKIMLDVIEDYLSLNYSYTRFDGDTPRNIRQQRIDAFNSDDSIFCFLLTTRAGGYGINLTSADTVIIFDPDFNPHADIQALSRAHRIGQKKRLLVLRFVCVNSAEERIMQLAKKKMALDHLVVELMDESEEIDDNCLSDILSHGAKHVFDDDVDDVVYDDHSVDELLDRSRVQDDAIENNMFSYAQIWNDEKPLEPPLEQPPLFWKNLLENYAKEEEEEEEEATGKGKRRKEKVDYVEPFQSQDKDEEFIASEESESESESEIIDDYFHKKQTEKLLLVDTLLNKEKLARFEATKKTFSDLMKKEIAEFKEALTLGTFSKDVNQQRIDYWANYFPLTAHNILALPAPAVNHKSYLDGHPAAKGGAGYRFAGGNVLGKCNGNSIGNLNHNVERPVTGNMNHNFETGNWAIQMPHRQIVGNSQGAQGNQHGYSSVSQMKIPRIQGTQSNIPTSSILVSQLNVSPSKIQASQRPNLESLDFQVAQRPNYSPSNIPVNHRQYVQPSSIQVHQVNSNFQSRQMPWLEPLNSQVPHQLSSIHQLPLQFASNSQLPSQVSPNVSQVMDQFGFNHGNQPIFGQLKSGISPGNQLPLQTTMQIHINSQLNRQQSDQCLNSNNVSMNVQSNVSMDIPSRRILGEMESRQFERTPSPFADDELNKNFDELNKNSDELNKNSDEPLNKNFDELNKNSDEPLKKYPDVSALWNIDDEDESLNIYDVADDKKSSSAIDDKLIEVTKEFATGMMEIPEVIDLDDDSCPPSPAITSPIIIE